MRKTTWLLSVCLALPILVLLLGCGLTAKITSEQLVLQHGQLEYKMEMPEGIPLIGDLGFKVAPYKVPVCKMHLDRDELHCVIMVRCDKPEVLGMRLEWTIENIAFTGYWIYRDRKFVAASEAEAKKFVDDYIEAYYESRRASEVIWLLSANLRS